MDIQNIVILGGGTAGWMTAAILARGLSENGTRISVVESPNIESVGVGEATIPPIMQLSHYLGLDERKLLKDIDGTYKYGIHFDGWSANLPPYMHAFGELGTDYYDTQSVTSFCDMWLQNADRLGLGGLAGYSPTGLAAYNKRFSPPIASPDDTNPNMFYPLSKLFYALQFDAKKLAEKLKQFSLDLGVKHYPHTVVEVTSNAEGGIKSLMLEGVDNSIDADLFVDCSGIKGVLVKGHLDGDFENWSQFLPCDRALAVQTVSVDEPEPYTQSIAMDSGWRWKIPLRSRNGNGYVYSSEFKTVDDAMAELDSQLGGAEKITDVKQIKFDTGCLAKPWLKNCVAIGLSSGFFEPLESTSIHLIHKYAIELKNAVVYGNSVTEEAERFNRAYKQDAYSIRDFLVMHYCTNKRQDSDFWRHCAKMAIPDSLAAKLDEFSSSGRISLPDGSLFSYQSWLQVLVGQGYLDSYARFSKDSVDEDVARQFFENVRIAIYNEVAKLPRHIDYLSGG